MSALKQIRREFLRTIGFFVWLVIAVVCTWLLLAVITTGIDATTITLRGVFGLSLEGGVSSLSWVVPLLIIQKVLGMLFLGYVVSLVLFATKS